MPNIPISINARQRCIIYALLKTEGRINLGALAKQTGLTPRIIRYNLDTVRAWFNKEAIELTAQPGYGIEIFTTRNNRKRLLALFAESGASNLVLTRGQRRRITLFELLHSDFPVTYQDLATNEGISRSTIINDVNEMQTWLNSYHLILSRTPNRGACIVGSEMSRRYAILNLLREELGERKWYSLWYQPDLTSVLDKSIPPNLEDYLKSLPFQFCYSIVRHIENLVGSKLALYSRIEVLTYLAISIDAFQKGKFEDPAHAIQLSPSLELQVSRLILNEIGQKFSLSTPEIESNLLAICLLGTKLEEDNLNSHLSGFEDLPQVDEPESARFANAIIATCSAQLHPLLRIDQELLISLTRHLKPVLNRIRYNLPILNDTLPIVQQDFPEVYRSAKSGMAEMEKALDKPVPPEEIGFVTMYLAAALNRLRTRQYHKFTTVLVGDGIRAKTTFLKARLEFEFPVLEVTHILNGYPADTSPLESAELILSLIPNEMPVSTPTLFVSPFLMANEVKQLQNWIIDKEQKSHKIVIYPSNKPELVDLLLPKHITFKDEVAEWREMVWQASQPLVDGGKITEYYPRAMIQLIEEYGPYMLLANGVLLLHARPVDGVNALSLSMLRLQKGVQFNPETNPVDIAFVLGAVDDTSHLIALFQLSRLIESQDFVQAIRCSSSPVDVLRAIWVHASLTAEPVAGLREG